MDANRIEAEQYRAAVPANAMRRVGVKADVVPYQLMQNFRVFQWNTFVFRMLYGEKEGVKRLLSLLKGAGARVIYDWDDDPQGYLGAAKVDPMFLAELAQVNTVSTPALRRKVPNSVVLPNCLDFSLWTGEKEDGPLTVGLVGGASHLDDWRQIKEPLRSVRERYGVRLFIGGYYPGYLRELEMEFRPWVPYTEYPDVVREIDILLCPVTNDEFNLYKSGIKALEGMSVGAVPVCSDHPIYRRVVNHKNTGLLVKGDWEKSISLLIEDEKLRSRLSFNGQRWARKHRDIDGWIGRWLKTYSEAGVQ